MLSETSLTSEISLKQRFFIENGYSVLKSLLSNDEVALTCAAVTRQKGRHSGLSCERPNNTLVPVRWDSEIVSLLLGSEARLGLLRDVLDAVDLRWISGYISSKEPRSLPLWWHQDWWCWDHPISYAHKPTQVAMLCYLSQTSEENGALRLLPGSHHKSSPIHALLPEAHSLSANEINEDHPALSELQEQQTIFCEPGDAVLLDYRLLHGTHGNHSDSIRECVLLTFTPFWSDLPDDIRGHLIQHPAQPSAYELEIAQSQMGAILPSFTGMRRDLPVNRNAPVTFSVCSM